MLDIKLLDKEEIVNILNFLNVPEIASRDYVYDIYEIVISGLKEIEDTSILEKVSNINQIDVIQYILGEYLYSILPLNVEDKKRFEDSDVIKRQMATIVADKYLSLSFFQNKEIRMTNSFIPPMSSLNLYVNFMLTFVQNYRQNDPKFKLICDLLFKSLSITRCILKLLEDGYETEAFASWRTLHECECTLLVLDKYKEKAINAYFKHMEYGLGFKKVLKDKDQVDKMFVQIKEEMKELDLKSKDIKKYIEYGWLTKLEDFKNNPNLKLNFRDGLESISGLSNYSSRYMESSEILHSTPLLIYSNKKYFYYIALLSTYESFFRLEAVFVSLFASKVNKEIATKYTQLRKVYYSQLIEIHKREAKDFINWQKSMN